MLRLVNISGTTKYPVCLKISRTGAMEFIQKGLDVLRNRSTTPSYSTSSSSSSSSSTSSGSSSSETKENKTEFTGGSSFAFFSTTTTPTGELLRQSLEPLLWNIKGLELDLEENKVKNTYQITVQDRSTDRVSTACQTKTTHLYSVLLALYDERVTTSSSGMQIFIPSEVAKHFCLTSFARGIQKHYQKQQETMALISTLFRR